MPLHPFEGVTPGLVPPDPHLAPDRVTALGRSQDTEELLVLVDKHRYSRGSPQIFDALLEERAEALALALSRVPTHPLRVELIGWLRRRDAEIPDLPSPADLLLSELEERVVAQEKQVRELSSKVEQLGGLGINSARVAEVYAGACVVLVGVAILGWMAAFGILPFTPEASTPLVTESPKTTQGSGR